jgi:hypothetical protein
MTAKIWLVPWRGSACTRKDEGEFLTFIELFTSAEIE